jgi:hypothetical protein
MMSHGWKDISQIRVGDRIYDENRTRRIDPHSLNPMNPNGTVTDIYIDSSGDTMITVTWSNGGSTGYSDLDFEGNWNDLKNRWDL